MALKVSEAHPGKIVETRARGTDVRPETNGVDPWARDGSNSVIHYAHSPELEQWIKDYDRGLSRKPVTLILSKTKAGIAAGAAE